MPAKVVDASVIAAIVFQESRAVEAELLLKETDLCAPTLLAYELTNVALKKARKDLNQADAIEQALLVVVDHRMLGHGM